MTLENGPDTPGLPQLEADVILTNDLPILLANPMRMLLNAVRG